ncbi:MAG: glycosyltransferase family 4 protein [Patescibacteria group bacterium]
MKIAMIGQKGIPFDKDGGGIERHVEELSVRLAAAGHSVSAYIRPRFLKQEIKEYKGVKLIPLPSIPTKNFDTITYTLFASIHVLFQKVDVIHYHGVGPSTLAWIPRLFKPKARVIVTFHSIDRFHKKWGWFARLYLGWGEWTACHYPHKTIVVSHSLHEYCLDRFKKETVYIPNGVSVSKVNTNEKIQKFGLGYEDYILTVARLVKHKGIHYLIEAYKKIEQHFGTDANNWPGGQIKKLVIVGAPSFTQDYFQYLKKLSAGNPNIIFVGFQTGVTLAQLYANAYLYVHPSEAEGLSVSILEAMSHGRCVLTSNIPENLEIIDHGGYSFESKNIDDLYEKLAYLLDFDEAVKRRGEHGLEFIRENFDWDDITKEVQNVYSC